MITPVYLLGYRCTVCKHLATGLPGAKLLMCSKCGNTDDDKFTPETRQGEAN